MARCYKCSVSDEKKELHTVNADIYLGKNKPEPFYCSDGRELQLSKIFLCKDCIDEWVDTNTIAGTMKKCNKKVNELIKLIGNTILETLNIRGINHDYRRNIRP